MATEHFYIQLVKTGALKVEDAIKEGWISKETAIKEGLISGQKSVKKTEKYGDITAERRKKQEVNKELMKSRQEYGRETEKYGKLPSRIRKKRERSKSRICIDIKNEVLVKTIRSIEDATGLSPRDLLMWAIGEALRSITMGIKQKWR